MWVTEFEVKFSEDGEEWYNIMNGTSTVFVGNKDRNTIVNVRFPKISWYPFQVRAQQIRIYPKKWNIWPCLRFEAFFLQS